jgi:hypothetical protein
VSALPQRSHVDLFSYGEGIVDLDTQMADGALDFDMAELELIDRERRMVERRIKAARFQGRSYSC